MHVKYLVPKLTMRQYKKCLEFVAERKWSNWAVEKVYKSNSVVINIRLSNPDNEKQWGDVIMCVEEHQMVQQLVVTTEQVND